MNIFFYFSDPERNLHAPDETVCRLAGGGVQCLLDELPEATASLDFVDLAELVGYILLRVEVPADSKGVKERLF